jgi:MFS family permease
VRETLAPLADARVRPLLIGHLLGRLTPGMMVLAIVLAVREAGYPFAAAGVVAGGHQLGVALGSPLQGRIADAVGHRRVLVPDGTIYLAGSVALALALRAGVPTSASTAIALALGLASPPMTACTRAALGALYGSGRARERAYVLTVVNVELGFVVGPLLTTGLAIAAGGGAAVVGAGLAVALGTFVYATAPVQDATSANGSLRTALAPGGMMEVLLAPGLLAVMLVYFLISMAFGAFGLFAPAVAERSGRPALAGTLLAIISTASMIGGLMYGARSHPDPLRVRMVRLALLYGGMVALMPATAHDLLLLGVVLFLTGLVVGPLSVCGFQLIDDLSPRRGRAEAQSWVQGAVYLGGAIGGVIAGYVIDRLDVRATMIVGVVSTFAAAAVLMRARSLRHVEGSASGGSAVSAA